MDRGRGLRRCILALCPLLAVSSTASAAPGALDPSFGQGGKVRTIIGLHSGASDVAIQRDGKIVVVGTTSLVGSLLPSADFAIARYNTDGSRDPTFGVNGIVVTDFFGLSDHASAVAIQPDGKIVVVGTAGRVTPPCDTPILNCDALETLGAVARYKPNGTPDLTFGTLGKVVTELGGYNALQGFNDVALQPDGKIVVGGSTYYATDVGFQLVIVRYKPNGKLDPSFGGSGIVYDSGCFSSAVAVAIQADGKIVAASGEAYCLGFPVSRYTSVGLLDSSFGNGGKAMEILGDVAATAMRLQPDGNIVIAGYERFMGFNEVPPSANFALQRFRSDGTLDPAFGSGGTVRTHVDWWSVPRDLAIGNDGKIVTVGETGSSPGQNLSFVVVRHVPDGSLDGAFGTGGIVRTSWDGIAGGGVADGVAIQANRRIVAVGSVSSLFDLASTFAVVRYQGT